MIGSPPRPGTSVNRVATISRRARARATSGASFPAARRWRGCLSGAAVGAVAMEEIVLQIAEHAARCVPGSSGGLSTIRLPSWSIRPCEARLDHGRRIGLLQDRRPGDHAADRQIEPRPAPRCRASRRRTTPAACPSRALSSDADGLRRKHREVELAAAGRWPPSRSDTMRIASPASRRLNDAQIGRLRRRSGSCLGHAEAVRRQRHGQRHGNGVGLAEIVHVELVQTRRSARPRCPRRR